MGRIERIMSIIEYFFDVYCKYDFYKETKKIAPPAPLWRHITVFIIKMKEKPSIFTTKQQLTKGDSRKKTFLMKFFRLGKQAYLAWKKTIFHAGKLPIYAPILDRKGLSSQMSLSIFLFQISYIRMNT